MSCVGMGLNNLDESKEGIEKFLNRNPDTCYLAIEADEVIGLIMVGNGGRRPNVNNQYSRPHNNHSRPSVNQHRRPNINNHSSRPSQNSGGRRR